MTQSGTSFSKLLKLITCEKYNHASICLDNSFDKFYSFGRLYPRFLLPGGFVEENAFKKVYALFDKVPCMVLEKQVSDEQYERLRNIINYFIENKKDFSYAIISLVFANSSWSFTSNHKFFCSQFVAKVLNDIGINTPKAPEHMHPLDFTKVDGVTSIYEGDLKEFCKHVDKYVSSDTPN